MTPADLDRYRADPVWPRRVAAAGTIPRELEAERVTPPVARAARRGPPAGAPAPGRRQPARVRGATVALDDRLADGTVVVIAGAKHAAHHTHPDAVVEVVTSFLAEPGRVRLGPCLDLDSSAGSLSASSPARSPARSSAVAPREAACPTSSSASLAGSSVAGWPTRWVSSDVQGFIAVIVVAVLGSLVVRLVLNAVNDADGARLTPHG